MPKRTDIIAMTRPACALAILSAAIVSGCAQPEKAAPRSVIADFDPAQHSADTLTNARWQMVIHSGAGIPGTPGAQNYYRKPKQVLQAIVDTCELGPAVYQVATDGVSVLTILNDALSEEQIACVRSAEDSGLRLSDRGTDR